MKNSNDGSIQEKKQADIMNDDGISVLTCNNGGASLSCGTSCIAGMDNPTYDNEYEEPELICLDGDEGVTKQTCNTGGSEISCNSSCSAGISPDNGKNQVITTCNTGK